MGNRWKEIWGNRNLEIPLSDLGQNEFTIYQQLKKLDGFDVSIENEKAYYGKFYKEAIYMCENLIKREGLRAYMRLAVVAEQTYIC